MNLKVCVASAALILSAAALAGEPPAPVPSGERERLDALIKQNLLLTEEVLRLRPLADRPRTNEELFAMCMQAAKGQGAMAASAIGSHCSQILKK